MSSSTSSSITISSGLVLNKINSNKLDYLYEVFVEPDMVNPTSLPVINPYTAFGKQSLAPLRQIKSLIKYHPKGVKQYIQASKVDQYPIPTTKKKQFITLHIPNDFLHSGSNKDIPIFILGLPGFPYHFMGEKDYQ